MIDAEATELAQIVKAKNPRRIDWSLTIGLLIVGFVLLIAVAGPKLAPHDPMQTNFAVPLGGKIYSPPFPAFTIPGFPLGSDQFGRDLLSRLLWGVAPTLLMVIPVALVRLVLGMLIGLVTGFTSQRAGRFLEALISAALAIPVLLVAIGGIVLVGVQRGLIAFIFGLALTGWADTARFVQEQTKLIKQQPYIEAAKALGGTPADVLFGHVLRQILPYVWMMLAFEISGTLLVTAELGFLGYYIGGGVWIEVFDFVSVNTTGLPELGQMLGTAMTKLTSPQALLVTGALVFIIILGFNLLGDGLRNHLSVERIKPLTFFSDLAERLDGWLEKVTPVKGSRSWRWGVAFFMADMVVVGILTGWLAYQLKDTVLASQSVPTQALAASLNPWPMERHDPQGTLYTSILGPQKPSPVWSFQDPVGFTGGPVVAQDGTTYIAGGSQVLYAFSADGEQLWQVNLPELPVGGPALDAAGEIYVVGKKGGLTAFKPDGKLLWSLPSNRGIATSGPIVASDGKIYYTIIDSVRVVSPDGVLLALWPVSKQDTDYPPRLSPDEKWIMLHGGAISRVDGSPLDASALFDEGSTFSDPIFVVGGNGSLYLRSGHGFTRWEVQGAAAKKLDRISWDPKGTIPNYPADAGVTANSQAWMVYGQEYSDTRIAWIDGNNLSTNNTRLPYLGAHVIGVDRENVMYLCNLSGPLNCYAIRPGSNQPLWTLLLTDGTTAVGGALLPGRMLVAAQNGMLYSLDDFKP